MGGADRKQPALIGGVIVGVLSIIPFLDNVFCCCLWALLGGIVAAKVLVDRSPRPVLPADGAMVGLLAGAIGGAIHLLIGPFLGVLSSGLYARVLENVARGVDDPQVQEAIKRILERFQEAESVGFVQQLAVQFLFYAVKAVVLVAITTLGGLLGVALLEKRKGETPPPEGAPFV